MNTETENRAADALTGLVAAACGIAWSSAEAWLVKHDKKANLDALASCIKSWTKATIQEAVNDARKAVNANMPDVAAATFKASMVLAGIEAAEEASR